MLNKCLFQICFLILMLMLMVVSRFCYDAYAKENDKEFKLVALFIAIGLDLLSLIGTIAITTNLYKTIVDFISKM